MKTPLRLLLVLLILTLTWQASRIFFSAREQQTRSDIRNGFQQNFREMAAASHYQ